MGTRDYVPLMIRQVDRPDWLQAGWRLEIFAGPAQVSEEDVLDCINEYWDKGGVRLALVLHVLPDDSVEVRGEVSNKAGRWLTNLVEACIPRHELYQLMQLATGRRNGQHVLDRDQQRYTTTEDQSHE